MRVLSTPDRQPSFRTQVPFRPSVVVTPADFSTSVTSPSESAAVVHYTAGIVHAVDCFDDRSGRNADGRLSISSVYYAHRFVSARQDYFSNFFSMLYRVS